MRPFDLIIGSLLTLMPLFVAAPGRAEIPEVTSAREVRQTAVVQQVQTRDGMVSGVIANKSPRLLRDVKIMVRHTWLWSNERHPGDDSPGRTEYYMVPDAIPAGESAAFSYRLDTPLPERSDGHFVTEADVISFTEVGQ